MQCWLTLKAGSTLWIGWVTLKNPGGASQPAVHLIRMMDYAGGAIALKIPYSVTSAFSRAEDDLQVLICDRTGFDPYG
ncbi:hypothetical protein F5Y19DRAFT_82820 [Xylariaceae sp. FL1651]|nr:hypothetical protein F5Y19DRAFT_82820 [Xylariaceae sp. FL1651]